jgi:hypothetical protein
MGFNINLDKKYIYILSWILIIVIIFFIFWKIIKKDYLDNKSLSDTQTESQKKENLDSWDYYNSTAKVNISENKNEEIEKKLLKEWKIVWLNLKFDKDWFKNTSETKIRSWTNLKIEIDTSDSWLQEWTNLEISIWDLISNNSITVPWRYKYSLYFNKIWEYKIILKWKDLNSGQIEKVINVR